MAAIKKPSKPATAIKKPGAKPGKAAAKPAAAPKPPKEVKPFEVGQIVTFKGYSQPLEEGQEALFQPDQELAVVGESKDDAGNVYVACVAVSDYHKYQEDPDSVGGQELVPLEVKRTNRVVEPEYHMTVVGDLASLQEQTADPLELGLKLYGQIEQGFFYLGGVLGKLWKERDEEGTLLFSLYERAEGLGTTDEAGNALAGLTIEGGYTQDSEGFALFLADHFPNFGGIRKAKEYIGIYDTFSVLPNAEEVIGRLAEVGWWKAGMIRSYLTEENAAELVEAAATLTKNELASHLKTSYTTEGSDGGTTTASGKNTTRAVIKKDTFTFQLYEDQGEGVKLILNLAKKSTSISDDNALFEHIMQEWATDHLGADGVAKAEQAASKRTEALRKQGVKFPEGHKEYKAPEPKPAKGAKTEATPAPAKPAAARPLSRPAKPAAKPAAETATA